MVDAETLIVSTLKTNEAGLKVNHENFLDSDTATPCISYFQINNSVNKYSTDIVISNLAFRIKVWAKSESDLVKYSQMVDTLMHSIRFHLTNANDLWQDNIGQRSMRYENLGYEEF